jgi:signal transduction histidine kinase
VLVLVAVGIGGAVATALTAWAVSRSPILVDPKGTSIWRSLVVASYVGVGLYTWWRRPRNRLGPLLVGNGFLYAATSFNASGASPAYTLGMVIWAVYVVYTAYVLLSYPRGRLESGLERTFIRAYALSTAVLTALTLALSPSFPAAGSFNNCGTRCPANALAGGDAAIGTAVNSAASIVFTIALIGLTMLLIDKARATGPGFRRAVAPVAAVFTATVAWFVIALYLLPAYPGTASAVTIVDGVLGLAIPMAILLGQLWEDRFATISLGQIAVRARGRPLTPSAVQEVLADALGDPTVTLGVWDGGSGYVDVNGEPVELPVDPQARAVTRLSQDGRPVAALIHDPMLDTDSPLVEGLAASSLMMLENARLIAELHASRARIAETADRERRKLERDLHDGAQQRLMAIQIKLRMLKDATEDENVSERLEAVAVDAEAAVEELRSLAHGIYPPLLRDHGLPHALRSFARRAAMPIAIVDDGIGRCSRPTESAIYFCSMEAIQNVAKHAGHGTRTTITLGRDRERVLFAISDDGIGMDASAPRDGDGLVGMRDRIGAVGGEFEITSTPGHGTTINGTVPIGASETSDDQSAAPATDSAVAGHHDRVGAQHHQPQHRPEPRFQNPG